MKWFKPLKRSTPDKTAEPTPLSVPQEVPIVETPIQAVPPEVPFIEHYPYNPDKDPRLAEVEQRLLDYFLPDGRDNAGRAYYVENDLVKTNNLSLWIREERPGLDLWDYREQPFAEVFGQVLEDQQELIAEANKAVALSREHIQRLWDEGSANPAVISIIIAEGEGLEQECDRLMTEVFRALAPRLLDAGHDPLELCL